MPDKAINSQLIIQVEDLESDMVQQTMTNETFEAENSRLAKSNSDLEQITRENMQLRHEVHYMRQALQVTYVNENKPATVRLHSPIVRCLTTCQCQLIPPAVFMI